MIRGAGLIGALALAGRLVTVRAEPVQAQTSSAPAASRPVRLAGTASRSGRTEVIAAIDAVARRYALAGEVLVAKGDRILLDRGYGTIAPNGGAAHRAGERWRLASITKQVTAALVVREFGATLDQPMTGRLDFGPQRNFDRLTLRHLLTHHSGLPNPDDTPKNEQGVPAFYRENLPFEGPCYAAPAQLGSAFSYNNCDYLIAGTLLEFADGGLERRLPRGMRMAVAGETGLPGFVASKPEPTFNLTNWALSGGLIGTARAVFDFDRSLMTGKLLPPVALAELWKPEGNGSYQALGAWVFPGKLKGCAAPKRIVQRDGEIWGVQARNYILPDDDLVAIVFTNRSADDFAIGEVWEGKGFAFDLLSAAAAC